MIVRTLQKLKFEYSSLVAREPLLAPLYRPVLWWQQYKVWRYYSDKGASPKECVVGSHTEFVLDGFQGSANSFAADAFKQSQERPVMMAHHMHSPAQIIKGIRRRIPTMVTIRNPVDASLSLTSRWPFVSMRQALRAYVGFYGKLEPYAGQMVLSPFTITIHHLDKAILAVNERFDTDFDVSQRSLQQMREEHGPGKQDAEEKRQRAKLKEQKARELEKDACQDVLQRAEALHRRLIPFGVRPTGVSEPSLESEAN